MPRSAGGYVQNTSLIIFYLWTSSRAGIGAPRWPRTGGGAGDMVGEGLGEGGKTERRRREPQWRAHRGRERSGRWPPAVSLAGGLGLTAEVALRCFPDRGKELRRRDSLRGCLWRRHFPPADGNRGESARTTGGVRRTAAPARSSGGGARWGELGQRD
jgi:hypothetical protein